MFDPGGFTDRLRACLFLGMWRALLRGEVPRLGAGRYPRVQRFLDRRKSAEYHFPEWGTSNSYVLRSIAVFSAASLVEICRAGLWEEWTDVRERQGARRLMTRNSAERLVASAIWSWENAPFPGTSSTWSQSTFRHLQVWHADFRGCVWLIHCTAVLFE